MQGCLGWIVMGFMALLLIGGCHAVLNPDEYGPPSPAEVREQREREDAEALCDAAQELADEEAIAKGADEWTEVC
jgi:hypothetical protein